MQHPGLQAFGSRAQELMIYSFLLMLWGHIPTVQACSLDSSQSDHQMASCDTEMPASTTSKGWVIGWWARSLLCWKKLRQTTKSSTFERVRVTF